MVNNEKLKIPYQQFSRLEQNFLRLQKIFLSIFISLIELKNIH